MNFVRTAQFPAGEQPKSSAIRGTLERLGGQRRHIRLKTALSVVRGVSASRIQVEDSEVPGTKPFKKEKQEMAEAFELFEREALSAPPKISKGNRK